MSKIGHLGVLVPAHSCRSRRRHQRRRCLLPLWVARCCAHRCCAPSRPSYSTKHKAQAFGCCSLWGLALLMCVAVGVLSFAQAAAGVQARGRAGGPMTRLNPASESTRAVADLPYLRLQVEACTMHSSLGVAAQRAGELNASVSALADCLQPHAPDLLQPPRSCA